MTPLLLAAAPVGESFDILDFVPIVVTAAVAVGILILCHHLLLRSASLTTEGRFPRQLVMLGLTGAAVVAVLLALPIGDATQGQLLGLFGVILTAIIGLSSTTFIANAMAGLMLRSVRSFKAGDFVRVGGHFGRVTERGLFHLEIQTEDRDLMTLPNLYLVQNPIRVVRSSGTIVSASLSLGYDVAHGVVEPVLLEAAVDAELQDAFVQVVELGDFAVTYRIAGFLPEVKHILSARSRLHRCVLDALHRAGVEIVSPTFMNQRRVDAEPVIPEPTAKITRPDAPMPEERIFDKADEAQRLHTLRAEAETLEESIAELRKQIASSEVDRRESLERVVERRQGYAEALAAEIAALENTLAEEPPDRPT